MKGSLALVFLATVLSAATPEPDYMISLNGASLLAAAQAALSQNPQKIRVVIADSGLSCTALGIASQVNTTLSKSWVDESPCTDQVGHGSIIATIFKTIDPLPNVEFVSLKIISSNGTGGGAGTLGSLIAALTYVASWNDSVPTIVNLSLENYPGPDEVSQLMGEMGNVFFSTIAGNYSTAIAGNPTHSATYPGAYAQELANAICVGSFDFTTGWISDSWNGGSAGSNSGPAVEIAGVGTISPNEWGTSYVAPQADALAALLMTIQPNLTPAMIKMLILAGGTYDPNLVYWIGDIAGPFPARTLSGSGALQALQNLQSLQLTGSQPIEIQPGESVTISTSVDAYWLSNLNPNPVFQVSQDGSVIGFMKAAINQGVLQFTAPTLSGVYQIQLVVAGVAFGDPLPIMVSSIGGKLPHRSPLTQR